MRLALVTPHFEPDVAPTGAVWTRIVHELVERGHSVDVITSLPWYRRHRIEEGFEGKLVRHEDTPWGRISRVHPFPAADKSSILKRAAAFGGFSALAAAVGRRGPRLDGVIAVSPPLTLGLVGRYLAARRGGPLIFNIQDVFPDVAIELGVLTNRRVIAAGKRLELWCYRHADAITVLSDDLRANIGDKIGDASKVRVIPNFVDTERIVPAERENDYRREQGLAGKVVVMYAGNLGLSQSLDIVLDAAAALSHEENVAFVLNGEGARRAELERRARGMGNVTFVDMQPPERLAEVLAAGDIHLVPLKRGLASASVPSKIYSILAAGRPLVASVDSGSEVARVIERAGAGLAVAPEEAESLTKAIRRLLDSPAETQRMGRAGRAFVETWASPAAIAESYEGLFEELR